LEEPQIPSSTICFSRTSLILACWEPVPPPPAPPPPAPILQQHPAPPVGFRMAPPRGHTSTLLSRPLHPAPLMSRVRISPTDSPLLTPSPSQPWALVAMPF
jgi:hypothetical protein